jgi:hypothetical protein
MEATNEFSRLRLCFEAMWLITSGICCCRVANSTTSCICSLERMCWSPLQMSTTSTFLRQSFDCKLQQNDDKQLARCEGQGEPLADGESPCAWQGSLVEH